MNNIVGNISEGAGVPNSSGSFGFPISDNTIEGISISVSSLLDDGSREILRTKQEEFSRLVDILEIEVEVIRTQNKYNFYDYSRRLMASDKIVEKGYNDLFVTYPNLVLIYNQILAMSRELGIEDLIITKLYKKYFEDLVYVRLPEDVDYHNYSNYFDFNSEKLEQYSVNRVKSSLLNFLSKAKYISFSDLNLNILSINELKIIFNSIVKLKGISFVNMNFDDFSFEQLDIIFFNFDYVRYVDFVKIDFGSISAVKLSYIFSKIHRLHYINLNLSTFGGFSDDDIVKIFSSLKGLKQLYLYKMLFTQDQQELISSVLIGTKISF